MGKFWARLQAEGHDDFGAYDLPLGLALLVSYALLGLLNKGMWVGAVLWWIGVCVALWKGHEIEIARVWDLGRRRHRGTLSIRLTWIALLWSFFLAMLAVRLSHARALHTLVGWHDGPLVLLLTFGLFNLATGCKASIGRRVYLGLLLCAIAVLVVGVPLLRTHLHWSTAILGGGALLLSGYVGRRVYRQRLSLIRGT